MGNHLNKINFKSLILLSLISIFAVGDSFAQLTLSLPKQVCKNESLLLKSSSSKTIISYNWNFGDGKSSSQSVPFYRYTIPGTYTVQLNVQYSDNSMSVASATIDVFDVPNAAISLSDSSITCLNINKILLNDLSTAGKNSKSVTRRLILWGDGDISETDDPLLPNQIQHHYSYPGIYEIDVEYENDKKCKVKTTVIAVVYDFSASKFNLTGPTGTCDSLRYCVKPMNNTLTIIFQGLDWGDGTKEDNFSATMCHYYKKSGTFNISLMAKDKASGCSDTTIQRITQTIPESTGSVFQKRYCLGETGFFRLPGDGNEIVNWKLTKDTAVLSSEKLFKYQFPELGTYYLEAVYQNGKCVQHFKDTIEVVGFHAKIQALNANRPYLKDTIYFNAVIKDYDPGRFDIFWTLGDKMAPMCTSAILNTDNCNYSTSVRTKHFYNQKGDFRITLNIYDKVTGCSFVDTLDLSNQVDTGECECNAEKNVCENEVVGKAFKIKMRPWYHLDSVLYDLYCPDQFLAPNKVVYKMPCSASGFITTLLKISQDNRIYSSNDSNIYTIDSSIVPNFTAIYNNWLRIRPSPKASFSATSDSCPPGNVTFQLHPNPIYDLDEIEINWGDGTTFKKQLNPNVSFSEKISHTYGKLSPIYATVKITNLYQCSLELTDTFNFYHNSSISEPPYSCNPSVELKSSIHSSSFIGKAPKIVTYMWDDGDGLRYGNENHTVYFTKSGMYPIKLVTINQFNCTDTFIANVVISGIKAGIKSITKKLLCDDIIQFRDSSGIFGPRHSDTIVKYTWDFGEGKAVSHLKNPFYYYRSQGEKIVTLKVQSSKGCIDTTSIRINIPGPIPFFSLSDTLGCVPFTIEVRNLSKNARDYIWFMGDPSQSIISTQSDTNFKFTYDTPGTYHLQLFASDSVENPDNKNELYYCGYYFPDKSIPSHPERKVIVLPKPSIDFKFFDVACFSKELKLYGPIADDGYSYIWKLNGKVFSQEKPNTTVRFDKDGQQTLSLNISKKVNGKDVNCSADTSKLINVFGQKVDLDIQKNNDCISYLFKANENSTAKYDWSIEFLGRVYSAPSSNEVSFSFKSYTGPAKICVSLTGKEGCIDTACKRIEVDSMNFEMTPFNVFTPGKDGKNDIFFIQVENYSLFELNIYNRWGERVFSSNNPDFGWDGNDLTTGKPMPDGTYFYILETAGICSPDNERKRMSGSVTLIREKQ